MVSLLPSVGVSEKTLVVSPVSIDAVRRHASPSSSAAAASSAGGSDSCDNSSSSLAVFRIRLRNMCLEIVGRLVAMPSSSMQHGVNVAYVVLDVTLEFVDCCCQCLITSLLSVVRCNRIYGRRYQRCVSTEHSSRCSVFGVSSS
jgi:hypothetical protein